MVLCTVTVLCNGIMYRNRIMQRYYAPLPYYAMVLCAVTVLCNGSMHRNRIIQRYYAPQLYYATVLVPAAHGMGAPQAGRRDHREPITLLLVGCLTHHHVSFRQDGTLGYRDFRWDAGGARERGIFFISWHGVGHLHTQSWIPRPSAQSPSRASIITSSLIYIYI